MRKRKFSASSSLMRMAILAAVALSCGSASAQYRPGSGLVPPPPPVRAKAAKAGFSKEALNDALDRYFGESDAALDARLADLKGFFEDLKPDGRLFAQSVLGVWGKLDAGTYVLADVVYNIGSLFGEMPKPPSLSNYVRDRFRAEVLDPEKAKQAVDDAVAGFLGDLAGIEGKLLVDLRADLGDDQLNLPASPPKIQVIRGDHFNAMIGDMADTASKDLAASLAMYVVSNVIGDKIADRVTPEDASKGRKLLSNVAIGIAVDKALEEGVRAAGYDPESAIAVRIAAGLDQIRSSLIDGDPAARRFYPHLSIYRRTHPDEAVRDACLRADEAVVRSANLGLHLRLQRLRNDRCRRLWTVLTGRLIGPEAARSPFLMYQPLDPATVAPPEEIIRWANKITTGYGGSQR
jgi:hypothetical protein